MEVFSVFHPHRFQFVLVTLDGILKFITVPLPRLVRFLDHLIVSILPDVELKIPSELMLHAFAKTVAKSTLRPAVAFRIASRSKAATDMMATITLAYRHPFTTSKAFAMLPVGRVHVPDVQAEDAVQLLLQFRNGQRFSRHDTPHP